MVGETELYEPGMVRKLIERDVPTTRPNVAGGRPDGHEVQGEVQREQQAGTPYRTPASTILSTPRRYRRAAGKQQAARFTCGGNACHVGWFPWQLLSVTRVSNSRQTESLRTLVLYTVECLFARLYA